VQVVWAGRSVETEAMVVSTGAGTACGSRQTMVGVAARTERGRLRDQAGEKGRQNLLAGIRSSSPQFRGSAQLRVLPRESRSHSTSWERLERR